MSTSKRTKTAIAQTLIDLCETESFHQISMQKIAKKVGLNRQTLYYHFTDKNDLLRWIYQTDIFMYLNPTDVKIDNWEEQVLKMLKAIKAKETFYFNTVQANADILLTCFFNLTNQLFITMLEQADEEKQLLTKDKLFYARFLSYGCGGILINWIKEHYPESPLEVATELFRLAKDLEFFSYRLYVRENH